ncbi:hypothetical protein OH77DRAFT_1423537 [Trametes cingulata]|nr:hypothetical protein OH77DRAFT_1423537 [Trametes cingulata]
MSSLSTKALRGSLRRAASCSRYNSSQASSSTPPSATASSSTSKLDVQPKQKLTEEKMRVLVNLYHQSATYITKENLDRRIDEAFIDARRSGVSVLSTETPFHSLQAELAERRALPKFGMGNEASVRMTRKEVEAGQAWSNHRPPRQRAIISTLYGVLDKAKPAYDALMDEQDRIKQQLKADKQGSRSS